MAESTPDPSRPRRGRFRRWFSGLVHGALSDYFAHDTRTPAPQLDATDTARNTRIIEFTTPAKGDAYDFRITAELCFCATGALPWERLTARIDFWVPDLTAEIKASVRSAARRFPPFRPGAAEPVILDEAQQAVTRALTGLQDVDGVHVDCSVRLRVDMDPEIRDLQRTAVIEQVKFNARYDQSEYSAQRLGELRTIWSKFIKDGLPMWETPYAILMAQHPNQVAATLFQMRKDRRDEAAKLVETVAQVADGHERMDLLEFALATDSALSKTYELLGIAQPEGGADSLFSSSEGEAGSS
ncbi:hypothetical protein K8Z49_25265 [Actinomadura madurae]|uniref:hypothetical protein n=1 Tax=Actinomadura madurae TaxID=1993 RepID=UPI00399BD821